MYNYRCIAGEHEGHTALGVHEDGVFKVQMDDFDHPMSHGWHEAPEGDWVLLEDDDGHASRG